MYIGVEVGIHDVPEPIWPMDIMFVSLEPTRTPMLSSDITISGPMFIDPLPGMPSMPFMLSIVPGLTPGLCDGIGIFMSIFGDDVGDAPGDIPGMGMFISICGDAAGLAD